MIDHGSSVVVGETAVIGYDCSFLHGVTLGSTGKEGNKDRHPKLGNNVLIGCNATVLGNISIGNNCKIGSNSLVIKSLPDGVTAVGNPARIISSAPDIPKIDGRNLSWPAAKIGVGAVFRALR